MPGLVTFLEFGIFCFGRSSAVYFSSLSIPFQKPGLLVGFSQTKAQKKTDEQDKLVFHVLMSCDISN